MENKKKRRLRMYKKTTSALCILLLSFLIYPISALCQEKAKKLTVYKVDVNRENDTIKTLKYYYEYNDLGKETITKYYDRGKQSYWSEKKYLNDSILIAEYSILLQSFTKEDTMISKYYYDKHRRLKIIDTKDLDGNDDSETEYFYDDFDRMTLEKRSNGIEATYQYDSLSNLTSINYIKMNVQHHLISYKYNSLKKAVSYTTAADPGWNNYYIYDRHGNKAEFLRFNKIGELYQKITYEYDSLNRLIKEQHFDWRNNEVRFAHVYVYE